MIEGEAMRKVALFAFNGEPACFAHVLLNAMDMQERGYDVCIVIEGKATAQVKELGTGDKPFSGLYRKVREAGLIDGVCKACAAQMKTLDAAKEQGLHIFDEMSGHVGIGRYLDEGYEVLVF